MKKAKLVMMGSSLFIALCITTAMSASTVLESPAPMFQEEDDEKENSFPCILEPDRLFIYCSEGTIDCAPRECDPNNED
jgi:hypothetical protein